MPNWIEGTMKLRGAQKDIRRFFSEGVEPSSGWPGAKEYLRQLKRLEIQIEQRRQERDRLLSDTMSNSSPRLTVDKVQTSISGDEWINL